MTSLLWACEIGVVYMASSLVVAVIVGRFLRSATLDPAEFASDEPAAEVLSRYRVSTPLELRHRAELGTSLARTMHEL